MKFVDMIRFWKRNQTSLQHAGSPSFSTHQMKPGDEKLRNANGDELTDEQLKQVAGGLNPQPIPPGIHNED